jgi:hypothetical protein
MGYFDAMKLPLSERYLMHIVLGKIHGGEYDCEKRKWTKPPTIL